MTTKPASSSWKTFGLLACAVAFSLTLQAQTSVRILATDPVALEGTSTGSFTLIRKGDTNSDLTVSLAISGSASNGVDYSTISSSIVIPAGNLAVDVPVQPLIDDVNRGNKTVVLALQANNGYTVAGRGHATVKIVDDVFDIPPPSVTLTSLADGSTFTVPASVTISADVESEVSIQRVGFYVDDVLVGTATAAPYTFTWNEKKTGKHTVFARAVDEFEKAGVSDTAHITLTDTPVVTVVPIAGTETFPGVNPLQAVIGDSNEQISSVSFYVNKKLVGTVTSAPFIFNWDVETPGTYTVKAVATDAKTGKTGTSPNVSITVFGGGA